MERTVESINKELDHYDSMLGMFRTACVMYQQDIDHATRQKEIYANLANEMRQKCDRLHEEKKELCQQ